MKRWNIAALLLAALAFPLIVMGYIPFFKDLKRNVAIKQGQEIVSKLTWFVEEYQYAPPTLHDGFIPAEDSGPEVLYRVTPAETTRFILTVLYGTQDSVVYDSKAGQWK